MQTVLENDQLRVALSAKGAELQSLVDKRSGLEYIWQADPSVWGKHSPVLFPIVGTLKDNRYQWENKWYSLPRHGFAREMQFLLADASSTSATLSLESSDQTKEVFPFDFLLKIKYSLKEDCLTVSYEVINSGDGPLYFSLGAHPAFNVPLQSGLDYEDYSLQFSEPETVDRWPITSEGLIARSPLSFFDNTESLPLSRELFAADALVFKSLKSNRITLRTQKDRHGFHFDFSGFPYFGLWAARNADFVCLEPWCGIADSENTNQQLISKEGVELLHASSTFMRSWSVQPF